MKTTTLYEFFKKFPNDDACLDHLMEVRYGKRFKCPKCLKVNNFNKVKKIPAYTCQCGHHIHPMVGTPFHKSRTPLQKWFYAMYLFTTTRHGVSAKEVQRQLGVTYKCAWRMCQEIRKYMGRVDGDDRLSGHVEVDETYIGGRKKKMQGGKGKAVVFGMIQRSGDVMTKVVKNARKKHLHPHIIKNIQEGSVISSDEHKTYKTLNKLGYEHGAVQHGIEEYVDGIHHVNSLEGFWGHLKKSIKSTHIHVSKKHLSKYLGEFEFRYNLRSTPEAMFSVLLASF